MSIKKHKEKLNKHKIKLLYFISFLMGFSQAILIYVMSSYFKLVTGLENVGIFYTVAYVFFLVILLNLHKFVRILGKANIFHFSLLLKLIVIFGLSLSQPSKVGIFLMIIYIILGHIEWVSLDSIIENFSTDKMSGRIRGMYLTILSAGILLGPSVSMYILKKMDFQGIFLFSLIINSFILIIFLIGFRNVNDKFHQKLKIFDIFKKVMRLKNIMRIYYISFTLDFFYALMIIYTPIYLRDLGFSWVDIGKIFTIMLLPFVLLQYVIGYWADNKIGEKKLLIFALLVMGCSTTTIYFVESKTILTWMIILFTTRIGASMIEILRDSYFYKKIDRTDVDLINFFRTALPVAYICATAFSSFLFLFLPVKFAFILTGIVVLSAIYPAYYLINNKVKR